MSSYQTQGTREVSSDGLSGTGGPQMQTRSQTGALPEQTLKNISEQAAFLSDDVSGMSQRDAEIGAGRNIASTVAREAGQPVSKGTGTSSSSSSST